MGQPQGYLGYKNSSLYLIAFESNASRYGTSIDSTVYIDFRLLKEEGAIEDLPIYFSENGSEFFKTYYITGSEFYPQLNGTQFQVSKTINNYNQMEIKFAVYKNNEVHHSSFLCNEEGVISLKEDNESAGFIGYVSYLSPSKPNLQAISQYRKY